MSLLDAADDVGKEIQQKHDANKAEEEAKEQAKEEAKEEQKQHEENKEQGML